MISIKIYVSVNIYKNQIWSLMEKHTTFEFRKPLWRTREEFTTIRGDIKNTVNYNL